MLTLKYNLSTMEKNVKLTINEIYSRQFEKDVKGYNPDEVDAFLDMIIQDYSAYEKLLAEKEGIIHDLDQRVNTNTGSSTNLMRKLAEQDQKIKELEVENASYKNRIGNIKEGDEVNSGNLELIQKINRYENFIYQMGYNPQTLKLRNK